jgi:hypothetical protein
MLRRKFGKQWGLSWVCINITQLTRFKVLNRFECFLNNFSSCDKNVNSINNYSTASVNQQKEMSSILTNYSGNDRSTVTHKETNISTVSIAQIPTVSNRGR